MTPETSKQKSSATKRPVANATPVTVDLKQVRQTLLKKREYLKAAKGDY